MLKIKTTHDKTLEALNLIAQKWGRVDTNQQSFSIQWVKGRYAFGDGVLTIVIDDKPWLATDAMIEREIKKFFN